MGAFGTLRNLLFVLPNTGSTVYVNYHRQFLLLFMRNRCIQLCSHTPNNEVRAGFSSRKGTTSIRLGVVRIICILSLILYEAYGTTGAREKPYGRTLIN
jgi:hypothetical protein